LKCLPVSVSGQSSSTNLFYRFSIYKGLFGLHREILLCFNFKVERSAYVVISQEGREVEQSSLRNLNLHLLVCRHAYVLRARSGAVARLYRLRSVAYVIITSVYIRTTRCSRDVTNRCPGHVIPVLLSRGIGLSRCRDKRQEVG